MTVICCVYVPLVTFIFIHKKHIQISWTVLHWLRKALEASEAHLRMHSILLIGNWQYAYKHSPCSLQTLLACRRTQQAGSCVHLVLVLSQWSCVECKDLLFVSSGV